MSLKDLLPDSIQEKYFEDENTSLPKRASQPLAAPFVPPTLTPASAPFAAPIVPSSAQKASSGVAPILADLRTKTDFYATPAGQQLKESTDALADTGLSEEQKSKTAMKLSHQSPSQVVSVLQGLQAVLVSEKQHFEASMQTATTAEVSARQATSAQLQSSIDAAETQLVTLRQQKTSVDAELQDKQQKISTARANYAAASEARNTELAEMISHYQSIPEVK